MLFHELRVRISLQVLIKKNKKIKKEVDSLERLRRVKEVEVRPQNQLAMRRVVQLLIRHF